MFPELMEIIALCHRDQVIGPHLRSVAEQVGETAVSRGAGWILEFLSCHPYERRAIAVDVDSVRGKGVIAIIESSVELSRLLRVFHRPRDWGLDYNEGIDESEKQSIAAFIMAHWRPQTIR